MGKKKQRYDRHLPPIGTRLKGKFMGREYFAEVVGTPDLKEGRGISYQGKVFATMTAAAKEITKQSVNGWRFWRLQ
jgi:hypothetical protein